MKWEGDLVRDIRTYTEFDNEDGNQLGRVIRDVPGSGTHREFSDCNRAELTEKFLKVKDQAKAVLEIGVCRNGEESSTFCFLNNKLDETAYVGIDLENKSFLDNQEKRIYTICGNSSDVDHNIEIMKSWGITELDFIFIDGWHSINQVLVDWEYTKILSPGGIVAFHDVSEHPGPHMFIRNLNTDIWNVEILCPTDWGIGFAWRK
jgi:hypothetical protein